MARRTRVEYKGACYHVINRGNYRAWMFEDDKTKEAFEGCLGETVVRMGWVVHSWVVMGNHFHLAVETPNGDLGRGMQWLQVTFAARFNAFRKERGHLFQGRYRAIPVQQGEALGRVCHYIDLNPVRAGVVPLAELESYLFGSYRRLWNPKTRPPWLDVHASLSAAGKLADNRKGWTAYRAYLGWIMNVLAAGRVQEFLELSRGIAIGREDFVEKIRTAIEGGSSRNLDSKGKQELKDIRWARQLAGHLNALPEKVRADSRVSAAWKAAVACRMKTVTDVSNGWLARRLGLGSPTYVSKQAGLARRGLLGEETARLLERLKGKT